MNGEDVDRGIANDSSPVNEASLSFGSTLLGVSIRDWEMKEIFLIRIKFKEIVRAKLNEKFDEKVF